jgi:hypothetical protein
MQTTFFDTNLGQFSHQKNQHRIQRFMHALQTIYTNSIVNLFMKHNNELSAFAPRDAPTEIIIEFSLGL